MDQLGSKFVHEVGNIHEMFQALLQQRATSSSQDLPEKVDILARDLAKMQLQPPTTSSEPDPHMLKMQKDLRELGKLVETIHQPSHALETEV